MKRLLTRLGWPILVALIIAGIYAYGKTRPVEVEIAEVTRGRIEEYVTEEAQTQLGTERVVTADLPGTARRITLEEGDPVEAGQVITTVEDTELKLYLDVMQASLKEIEGRLAGADVPLPKEPEVAAAEQERLRASQEVEGLEQDRKAAEAEATFAAKDFERIKGLFESGSATDQQYDRALRGMETAAASLAALERRLAAAQTAVQIAALRKQVLLDSMGDTAYLHDVYGAQLEQTRKMMDLLSHQIAKTRITSPITGVVLEKYVDSDQFVQPGAPLVKVGDMQSIEIRADILSDEVGRVQLGQQALLVGRAVRDPNARGRVKKIYPSGFTKISALGVRQQRVTVLIDFDNSELQLQPGYELDVKIAVAVRDDAVLVPSEAVFATGEGQAVFVVLNGRARLRTVSTGLKGDDYYEVTAGLEPGDVVILRPPNDLEPGSRVRPTAPDG